MGGLEAALALRELAGDLVTIELIAPDRWFTYRALTVGEPMGHPAGPRFDVEGIAHEAGFRFRRGTVDRVDVRLHRLLTGRHEVVRYERLIVSVGARPVDALRGSLTFSGEGDVDRFAAKLGEVRDRGGGRIVFVVPRGAGWSLPLYELAMLTEEWGRRHGLALDLTIVTREHDPLGVFGHPTSEAVTELLTARGIALRMGSFADEVQDGRIYLELEGWLEADLVVSLPRLVGPRLTGLPHDDEGFLPVDEFGRVPGAADVYAIGDATTRPLKQGGLTAQQADVCAADIAARAGADVQPRPYEPTLRGLLLTGEAPRFLRRGRHEEPVPPSEEPLWWPAHKVAGHHLAPFLAARPHLVVVESDSQS